MRTFGIILAFSSLLGTSCAQGGAGYRYLFGADGMGHMKRKVIEKRATSAVKTSSASATATRVADGQCTHGPRNRACWTNGFSVATDFDLKHPSGGQTRTYNLEITDTPCNPDGNGAQACQLINGQYPGPVITADWGDYLVINVKNSLKANGTSLHWHGIRQLNSVGSDGVNGVTECPIAPGDSFTYSFQATQFGTSWYHSHFSAQYGMGVAGPIVINGPATANYDVDLGSYWVTDWYYGGAWNLNVQALAALQAGGPPAPADTILINGTMKSANGGKYAQTTLQPGKKHRLRIINPSVDNFIRVKLDNHPFTVISADFIPTTPLPNKSWVLLGPGQRYDVVFTANATAGSYWFRAEVAGDCLSGNNGKGRGLFTYDGQKSTEPTDSNEAPPQDGCTELIATPFWKQPVDSATFDSQVEDLTVALTQASFTTNGKNLVAWALNFTAMNIDWGYPTLAHVIDGNMTFPKSYDIIEIPNEGVWTYWIVQTLQTTIGPNAIAAPPPPHPIHLHGHDFFVLGAGGGQFDRASANLNFNNPPRRDTATLPSRGWLALAWPANNPGTWLMHCHIAVHIGQGLGVQFLESKDQIVLPDKAKFKSQCDNWKKFQAGMPYPKYDSGL
ncbi:Iron transport multicopper oxidase [Sphaceloma murrayae]|uniref:laccase n=1 Tax=Sphaceloma murrayae TaxID=2082308 RepID=A0A2K1R137_9PEZI|nr:Iron transport multicopper oxidase [Sphaceloma murrayae]